MPHEQMNEQQVADYLHMDLRELMKLASRGAIPGRKTAKGFVFRKSDLDHWVEAQMHRLPRQRLAHIEKGVSRHHGFDHEAMLISSMIPPRGVRAPLHARTRNSVLRELIDLADHAGMVYAHDELLNEVRQREELCSTALAPGVAMPHPRHPLPYDIAASFVVVGLTQSGVPFGAADGSLTRLFFLICCKDDRTHLHVLARLAQMLHESTTGVSPVEQLTQASGPDELREILLKLEEHALENK